MERYCWLGAESSESSTLDAPLMENSGALDAMLVLMLGADEIGRLCETGVLSRDEAGSVSVDPSKRDERGLRSDCSTVTWTRGARSSGAADGVEVEVALGLVIAGFKLHLIV